MFANILPLNLNHRFTSIINMGVHLDRLLVELCRWLVFYFYSDDSVKSHDLVILSVVRILNSVISYTKRSSRLLKS